MITRAYNYGTEERIPEDLCRDHSIAELSYGYVRAKYGKMSKDEWFAWLEHMSYV